jgi:hypothetical protein
MYILLGLKICTRKLLASFGALQMVGLGLDTVIIVLQRPLYVGYLWRQ